MSFIRIVSRMWNKRSSGSLPVIAMLIMMHAIVLGLIYLPAAYAEDTEISALAFIKDYHPEISLNDTFLFNGTFSNMTSDISRNLELGTSKVTVSNMSYNLPEKTYIENHSIILEFRPQMLGKHEMLISYTLNGADHEINASFFVKSEDADNEADMIEESVAHNRDGYKREDKHIRLSFSDHNAKLIFHDSYPYSADYTSINGTIISEFPENRTLSVSINDTSNISIGNYILDLMISPVDSGESFSCSLNLTLDDGFECDFPPSSIIISEYSINGNLSYKNATEAFNTSFDLFLERGDFNLNTDYAEIISISERQMINLSTYLSDEPIGGSQIDMRITDPEGFEEEVNMEKISWGYYLGDFVPEIPGSHKLEVTAINGQNLDSHSDEFLVKEDNISIDLSIPSVIEHNYGAMNISGNLSVKDHGDAISTNETINISYRRQDGDSYHLCYVECQGLCEFSCKIEGIIEFTEYNLTATMTRGGVAYNASDVTDIRFGEADVDIVLSYSDQYLTEEKQDFFIETIHDGENIDIGTVYAEIIDPMDISYKFTPSRIYGGYAFSFIGLVPGNYTLNITFVSPLGKMVQEYDYEVLPDVAEITDEMRKTKVEKDRMIREALTDEVISEILDNHSTTVKLQLPSQLDSNISWLLLTYNDSLSLFDEHEFLPKSIERLRLSEYVPRRYRERLDGLSLFYAETEPLGYSVEKISETEKIIRLSENYERYENIIIDSDLESLSRTKKKNIIVEDIDDDEILSGIDYHISRDGLVDSISFMAAELSSGYRIKLLTEDPSFVVDHERRMVKGRSSVVEVRFKNPDISIMEDSIYCDIVIDNVTDRMIPSYRTDSFLYTIDRQESGEWEYKVFCGSDNKNIPVATIDPRPKESFSERSASIRSDESSRLMMSYNMPQFYRVNDEWREIDPNFYPHRAVDEELADERIEYVADRGIFSAHFTDLESDRPFRFRKDDVNISFVIKAMELYNASSEDTLSTILPNKDSLYRAEGDQVVYEGIFGDNTEQVFTYKNSELKSELKIYGTSELFEEFIGLGDDGLEVRFVYSMDIGSLRIDPQESKEQMPLRTEDYQDAGIYLARDYYYPFDNASHRRQMQRQVSGDAGNYTFVSSLPFREFISHDDIVIDPTFSVTADDRDAMSINDETRTDYHSEESPYLRFGHGDEEEYQTGLQFQLDVPYGSNITDAYMMFVSGDTNPGGSFNVSVFIENDTDVQPFIEGTGNISSREYLAQSVSWEVGGWSSSEIYESPDISDLIQEIVDNPGWSSGNFIGLALIAEDPIENHFRTIHGYSSPGNNLPILVLSYESDEAAPQILLKEPEDGSYISSTDVNLSYIPRDDDDLDYCELWGDFDGDWRLNQTDEEPQEGELNSFELSGLGEGEYNWNVWCTDIMGNAAFNESNSKFTVDMTGPSVQLLEPADDSEVSDLDLLFSFSATDVSDNLLCNLTYAHYDGILLDTIDDIELSSGGDAQIYESNLTVGDYDWSVDCVDEAGNVGSSDTFSFSVSRPSEVHVYSEHNLYSNFSVFEEMAFYANYTNSSGDAIYAGECTLNHDDSVEMLFNEDSSLFESIQSFDDPYNWTYVVNCTSWLFDDAYAESWFYLYPLVNTMGKKSVNAISEESYRISIDVSNYLNSTAKLQLHDFVPFGFDASFYEEPDSSSSFIQGGFIGTVKSWEFILGPHENGSLHYNVTPIVDDYSISELYMTSVGSRMYSVE